MAEKLDIETIPVRTGSDYPAPFDAPCKTRENIPLGLAAGLNQFGVNLTRLKPGVWSSQRHWHSGEDEFVYVLEGEVTLVTGERRTRFCAGDCVGFPAGDEDGHHFINETEADAVLLTVGTCSDADTCHYPDVDLHLKPGRYSGADQFTRKDGTPYKPAG